MGQLLQSEARQDDRGVWLVLAGGALLRLIMLGLSHGPRWVGAEAGQAAIGFARSGIVSDAYMPGQGPTAHLNPVMPVLAGTIYRVFGIRSTASEAILASIAILTALASFWLLERVFARLGTPYWARLIALALCCFLPVYQGMEILEFRIWEGALSVLLASAFINAMLAVEERDLWKRIVPTFGLAMLAAALLFVSPAFGIAAYISLALSVSIKAPKSVWLRVGSLCAVTLALIIIPWAIRNGELVGSPVLLRSNFGLELGMGYDPASLTSDDRAKSFSERQRKIHPFRNLDVFRKMKTAGGEVVYSSLIREQTTNWIRAHPMEAAILTLDHVRDYLWPPDWIMRLYFQSSPLVRLLRQIGLWIITSCGLIGIALSAQRGRRKWLYPTLFVAAPVCLYAVTTPIIRYHYAIYALMIFFGANGAAVLWSRISNVQNKSLSLSKARLPF